MTSPEKLKALLDLVYPNPFTKTTTTDVDGNIKVTYSASTPQPLPFTGMSPSTPSGRKVIDAMVNSLVGPIEIYENGKTYRKYSVVRQGLSDYISVEETTAFPSSPSWVKIRQNIKGSQGDTGTNAQSTI
jgi:hypothetical protein